MYRLWEPHKQDKFEVQLDGKRMEFAVKTLACVCLHL